MAAPKLLNTWGLTGKLETTYGTLDAPADTDGQLVVEVPEITETPIHDGARVGRGAGSGGNIRRVAQSGFENAFEAIMEAHGGGVAYSASVLPSVHLMLLIAGFAGTLDATPGTEFYSYAPESGPSGFDSASFHNFVRGQQAVTRGAYVAEMSIEADGPVVPTWTFGVRGIRNAAPTDVALPAITGYPAGTNLPPKALDISLSVNAVTTLVCRGFTFNLNRELSPRANDNVAGGHAGFSPGRRAPTLELLVEDIAKSTFDPIVLRDAGTTIAVSFGCGATKYFKWSISAPQAQIITAEPTDDGPTAMWTLGLELQTSGPAAEDDLTILFD